MSSAKEFLDKIMSEYGGAFGRFDADEENDESFATALHPIPGNRHTEGSRITVSIEDDIETAYTDSTAYVDEKTKPSMMGKPVDLALSFGFDAEHGRLNNFSMMGMKGGYLFYTARQGNVLICAELHVQKRHMADEDVSGLMDIVGRVIKQ